MENSKLGKGNKDPGRTTGDQKVWNSGPGKGVGERDCTLGTEEETGQVGPQARKRKRKGWDPWLRKVTEELGLS